MVERGLRRLPKMGWESWGRYGLEPGALGETRGKNLAKMKNWSRMDNARFLLFDNLVTP